MSKNKKRIVIIGATSAIAQHCARLWAHKNAVNLILVGRDLVRIGRVCADLAVRSPLSEIESLQADFLDPREIGSTVDCIFERGPVDIVLIAHGLLPEQETCQNNLQFCHNALEINAISPVLYAEAFAKHMEKNNHGTIALIGSVAGDRGRASNYVYGAAKGLLARYAQGMQHRFAGTRVNVVLIKPGPTDTPMTANLKIEGARLATVESVAKTIIEGISVGKPVVYAPVKWQLIMFVIMHLPKFIFNKMKI